MTEDHLTGFAANPGRDDLVRLLAAEIARTIRRMEAVLTRLAAADAAGDGKAHARALRERGQATVELNRLVGMFDRLTRAGGSSRPRPQLEWPSDDAAVPDGPGEPAPAAAPAEAPVLVRDNPLAERLRALADRTRPTTPADLDLADAVLAQLFPEQWPPYRGGLDAASVAAAIAAARPDDATIRWLASEEFEGRARAAA
jgi:hypothetical protein